MGIFYYKGKISITYKKKQRKIKNILNFLLKEGVLSVNIHISKIILPNFLYSSIIILVYRKYFCVSIRFVFKMKEYMAKKIFVGIDYFSMADRKY